MTTAGAYLESFIQILLKWIKGPSVKAKTNYSQPKYWEFNFMTSDLAMVSKSDIQSTANTKKL